MNDRQPIMLGFSNAIEDMQGYVNPYPDRKVTDAMIVKGNMVLAPQYIETERGIEITGWGLISAIRAVDNEPLPTPNIPQSIRKGL